MRSPKTWLYAYPCRYTSGQSLGDPLAQAPSLHTGLRPEIKESSTKQERNRESEEEYFSKMEEAHYRVEMAD